jgi:proline iminopeptidase
MCAISQSTPHDGFVPVGNARLYFREIGQGQPLIVLHGGPDFDHRYLLPDMDRLAETFHLIYYDQRGRGRSAGHVQPEDVSMGSDIEDLDRVREHFNLDSVTLLGHSWGALLALDYALHHSRRVSGMILMNPAPASRQDYLLLRQDRLMRSPDDIEKLKTFRSDARYQDGDPDTVAAYYRIHFRAALRRTEHHEQVIRSLRSSFTREGILRARAIEKRLMQETWSSDHYNLIPRLAQLSMPVLILHGDTDFIPAECAVHIAQAIRGAHFVLLKDCGHFSYLECPQQVYREIVRFFL